MELPADLSGFDRKTLHQLASRYNLSHHSGAAAGGQRRLVLQKDHFFFAKSVTRPTDGAIADLKANPGIHQRRRHDDAEEKPAEKELFADRDAYKAFRKLHKATNAYARAVETGLTEEDAAALHALEAGAASTGGALTDEANGPSSSAWDAALADAATRDADPAFDTIAAAAAKKELFEVCTECGTKSQVDYDPARWECCGWCEPCGKQTIFKLETSAGAELKHAAAEARLRAAIASDVDDNVAGAGRAKRERIDPATGAPEDDAAVTAARAAASETLSVAEIVELARMHDLSAADVKWVEAFATSRERQGATTDHVLFCADFEDFSKYVPSPASGCAVVYARIVQDGDAPLTKKVNRLLSAVEKGVESDGAGTATQDVFVCFPAFVPDEPQVLVALVVDSSRTSEASVKLAAKTVSGVPIVAADTLAAVLAGAS
jgi:hypothetical protein